MRLWTASEKSELIEQAAKAAVMDAQPLAQWTRVGMRGFLNHYGFPSFSWQAVDNARKSQYEKWVTGPLNSRLAMWKAPVRVVAGGKIYALTIPMTFSMDGWVGLNGGYYVSMILHGPQFSSSTGLGREKAVIAVHHWLPKEAEEEEEEDMGGAAKAAPSYTAHDLAVQSAERLEEIKVSPVDIFAVQADNEATNSRFTREEPFAHTTFLGCAQHSEDLMAEDLMKNEHFKRAAEASISMSVFMRASEKRTTPLLKVQESLGVPKHRTLLPVTPAPTRFLDNIYTQHRTLVLMDAYKGLYDALDKPDQKIYDTETKVEFVKHYGVLIQHVDIIRSFAPIGKVLAKLSPLLGSDKEYTISLQVPLIGAIEAAVLDAKKAGPSAAFESILDDLLCSAYLRLAPVHYWEAPDAPEGLQPPGENSLARKNALARDSVLCCCCPGPCYV